MEQVDKDFEILTNYILSLESFMFLNIDLIEDWAIQLLNLGYENETIFMLASFSKPIDSYEIKPYLKKVFLDLNLKEKNKIEAEKSCIKYHLNKVAKSENLRGNLQIIKDFYYDSEIDIKDFYMLFYAWDELEEIGVNNYYKNVDLKNIEEVVIQKAKLWINNN